MAATGTSLHHTAERWARAVWAGTTADYDPRTMRDWGLTANAAASTLRAWCYVAGASPRVSLLLTRLLRVVVRARVEGVHPAALLDVSDPRTMRSLLEKGGLSRNTQGLPESVAFLDAQVIVTTPDLIAALKRAAPVEYRTDFRVLPDE